MKKILFEIFGKPKLPIVLKQCILVSNKFNGLPIKEVFLFENPEILKTYTIESSWIRTKLLERPSLVGYFIYYGILNDKEDYKDLYGWLRERYYYHLNSIECDKMKIILPDRVTLVKFHAERAIVSRINITSPKI